MPKHHDLQTIEKVKAAYAITGSPQRTAEEVGIPRTTVIDILERSDPLAIDKIRREALADMLGDMHKAQKQVLRELIARLPKLDNPTLLATFRDLTDRRINLEAALGGVAAQDGGRASRRRSVTVTEEEVEKFG